VIGTRPLGHSGIEVSELILGAMMFGSWGQPDEAECHAMVDRALDAGITTIDVADIYDAGRSEEIVGEALRGRRDRVVLATKCGLPFDGDVERSGLSARWIERACEDSLRRLGTDRIDLYQMHVPDPATPMEETLTAFDRLVSAGKVRAIGTSNFDGTQVNEVCSRARAHGWPVPTSEQPMYSLLARGAERDLLPACRANDVGAIVYSPLDGGWLTGKYQSDEIDPDSRAGRAAEHFDHRNALVRADKRACIDALMAIASGASMTLAQLALAFVLDESAVSAAIIGPRTLVQLDQLVTLGPLVLPSGARAAIDAVVAPGSNVNPALDH
jgi:aryl-alcohol dehydrogenase-like predicted oxidoreductase